MFDVRKDCYHFFGNSRRVGTELDGRIWALLHLLSFIRCFGVWSIYDAVLHWEPPHSMISITLTPPYIL